MTGSGSTPWIAAEGVNGVGKTHLLRQTVRTLGAQCVPLVELPDTPPAALPGQVIGALHAGGDAFLRTGVPRTETLLLAALQVYRHESTLAVPGQVVLEERGPHTVAVYQAVILHGPDAGDDVLLQEAGTILNLIMRWRPLPDRVLLLVDDPQVCLRRFEDRQGKPAGSEDATLMARVGYLYELLATCDPDRFQIIDRRLLDEEQCVQAIVDACQATAPRKGERS